MSWLDNLIGFISPSWACKRESWRQSKEAMRNYDSGDNSRLNANWRAQNISAEFTDKGYRNTIRARARDLERNSDIAGGLVSAFERNVIGAGFQLQAKTEDDQLNETIERYWKEWCKPRNCDITRQQSFVEMCRMAIDRKKIDGGILFIKRYTEGGIVPFCLQAMEVDELDEMQSTPKNKANRVIGGIEYNSYNCPAGYWIRQYNIDGYSLNDSVYIDAKDVIFLWSKKRPSQIREMSDFAPTITRIRDINQYMEAVSVKERIAACLAIFIKKSNPTGTMGRDKILKDKSGYNGKTVAPGMIYELNQGEDVAPVNPANQGGNATDFVRLQQRLLSGGQGLSYETTSRDMSQVNYSSARQGLIEDEMTYVKEQQAIKDHLLSEVYETFVISLYLAGKINPPDFWGRKTEYLRHVWVTPARRWIDPQKEANANKIAMSTGQKTFAEIVAENGHDWKEQIQEMAEILEYGKTLGIDLGGVIFGQGATVYEDADETKE